MLTPEPRSRAWLYALALVGLAAAAGAIGYLLITGNGTSVRERIPASGGVVQSPSGFSVDVPAGALSGDAVISIEETQPPVSIEEGLFVGSVSAGSSFKVTIEGAQIVTPIRVEIPYDPASLSPELGPNEVFAAFLDEETGRWVPVDGVVDSERGVVVVETEHLSVWQVATWDLVVAVGAILTSLEEFEAMATELSGQPMPEPPQCDPDALPADMRIPQLEDPAFPGVLVPCLEDLPGPGHATLKVANGRFYSLLLTTPPDIALRVPRNEADRLLDAAQVALFEIVNEREREQGRYGFQYVFLPPGVEATAEVSFAQPDSASVAYEASDLALIIDLEVAALRAVGATSVGTFDIYGLAQCTYNIYQEGGWDLAEQDLTWDEAWKIGRSCLSAMFRPFRIVVNAVRLGAMAEQRLSDRDVNEGHLTLVYEDPFYEFDSDVRLIVELWDGYNATASAGLSTFKTYILAQNYPGFSECSQFEFSDADRTPINVFEGTIRRADDWTMPVGPLQGLTPDGRVYEMSSAELTYPIHATVIYGIPYFFINCENAPTP